jgi:hypothetical protein
VGLGQSDAEGLLTREGVGEAVLVDVAGLLLAPVERGDVRVGAGGRCDDLVEGGDAGATSGASPARAITARRYSGSLEIRTVSSRSPVSVIRTNTDRRRCRSIPTICLPSYAPLTRGLPSR